MRNLLHITGWVLLGAALLLGGVRLALAGAAHARDAEVRRFLLHDCPPAQEETAPCIFGLMLLETRLDDATASLRGDPHVAWLYPRETVYSLNATDFYAWAWQREVEAFEDGVATINSLAARDGVVSYLRMDVGFTLGDVWLALGGPPALAHTDSFHVRGQIASVYAQLDFDPRGLRVEAAIDCPEQALDWWQRTPVTLLLADLTVGLAPSQPEPFTPDYLYRTGCLS